jgi:hypothetical protein
VLCMDEKPMQALERKYPSRVGHNGILRREYEYIRHGTAALLATFNVRSGAVFGRVLPKRTAEATDCRGHELPRPRWTSWNK